MDRERIDAERHSAALIQRVLEHGTLQDWRLTRDYYGMDRIVADCKRLRTLDPKALSFICAMSNGFFRAFAARQRRTGYHCQ